MSARKIFWASITVIVASACGSHETRSLAWLRHADPVETAETNIANSHFVFYEVCGFACSTPSVGFAQYPRCYADFASIERIDSTGDDLASESHLELKDLARDFGARHNRLMAEHLDSKGFNSCRNGEDWDAAVTGIDDLVRSYDKGPARIGAAFFLENSDALEFRIDFNRLSVPPERIFQEICAVLRDANIGDTVRISDFADNELHHLCTPSSG